MTRNSKILAFAYACIILVGSTGLPHTAEACVKIFSGAPNVRVIYGQPTRIYFEDYEAFGSAPGPFCVCAFKEIGPIASIDSVTIQNAGSNTEIGGLNDFTANAVTSAGFEAVATGNFEGFATTVDQAIPEGLPVDIVFTVTLGGTATPNSLKTALEGSGGIGTDEGTNLGALTGNHQSVNSVGTVTIIIPSTGSALQVWGIGLTAGLLIMLLAYQRRAREMAAST